MQHALSKSTTNYERKKDQINAFECVVYFYSFFYKKKNNRYFLLENIFSEEERRTRSENGTVSDWGDEICNKRLDKSLGSPS